MYKVFKLIYNHSNKYGSRLYIKNKYIKYIVPFQRDFSKLLIEQIGEIARETLENKNYKIIGFSSDIDTKYSIVICE